MFESRIAGDGYPTGLVLWSRCYKRKLSRPSCFPVKDDTPGREAVTDTSHQQTLAAHTQPKLPSFPSLLHRTGRAWLALAWQQELSRAGARGQDFSTGLGRERKGTAWHGAPVPPRWAQSSPHHVVGVGSEANPWDVRVLQQGWEVPILPQVPSRLLEKGPKAPCVLFLAAPGRLALGRTCEFTPRCSFWHKELVFGVVLRGGLSLLGLGGFFSFLFWKMKALAWQTQAVKEEEEIRERQRRQESPGYGAWPASDLGNAWIRFLRGRTRQQPALPYPSSPARLMEETWITGR